MKTLYHGSHVAVPEPLARAGRKNLDFGRGFYLTSIEEQAKAWAIIIAGRKGRNVNPVLNIYTFDSEAFESGRSGRSAPLQESKPSALHSEPVRHRPLPDIYRKYHLARKGGRGMRDSVLWRKQSHIIVMLAEELQIDMERALDLYYSTRTCRELADPNSGLQLMSDYYILENILDELQ